MSHLYHWASMFVFAIYLGAACSVLTPHACYAEPAGAGSKSPGGLEAVKDGNGKVTGLMDNIYASYLQSIKPQPSQSSLDDMLKAVTRVRVMEGGEIEGKALGKATLCQVNSKDAIDKLRQCLQIKDGPSGHDMCLGEPTLEFYNGDKLVATMGFHHALALRWNRWKDDAAFKDGDRMVAWFAEHGVTGPKQEIDQARAQAAQSTEALKKWSAAMPGCLRPYRQQIINPSPSAIPFLPNKPGDLHARIEAVLKIAYPNPDDRILATLQWFGSGLGPWSGFPSYESFPESILVDVPTRDILHAVASRPLDQIEVEGAARYFGGWSFSQAKPADAKLLSADLRTKFLEHCLKSSDQDKVYRAKHAFGSGGEAPQIVHTDVDKINAASLSPDGKTLAIATGMFKTDKHIIKLLDPSNGKEIRSLAGDDYQFHALAFSPDGKTLASGSNVIQLWDVATGSKLHSFAGSNAASYWINTVAFSPDGKSLACGVFMLSPAASVSLWDVTSGKQLRTLVAPLPADMPEQQARIIDSTNSVSFSPDGKMLASCGSNGTIKLWQTASGSHLRTIVGRTTSGAGDIDCVVFSPDGKTMAAGSIDKTIKLWDVVSGRPLETMAADNSVRSVAFSPDGKTLASGSFGYAELWDAASGRKLRTFTGGSWVAFSADGKTLVGICGAYKDIGLWHLSGDPAKSGSATTQRKSTTR